MARPDSTPASLRARSFVPALFVALALLVAAAAYVAHALVRQRFLANKEDELRVIASLKVAQITAWRAERLADARIVAADPLLTAAVRDWLAAGARGQRGADLQARLASLRDTYGYERISLLDAGGALRLTVPGTELGPVEIHELAGRALATPEASILDLHRPDTGQGIHFELVAPLRLPRAPAGARPIAVLIFQGDPHRFLYPLVQSWPTASPSGETLLVRREGDEVVFLNELRHRKGTALVLRRPIGQANLPAALAAQGKGGVVDGRDYRGQRVLAALQRVPDSPWFLVSKVDHAEVVAPLARDAWLTALLAVALIALAGAGAQRVWRRERVVSDAALRESQAGYRALFENAIAGVSLHEIVTDPEGRAIDYVFLEVNQAFERLTGLRREHVVGRRVTEVVPGIEKDGFIETFGRVVATGEGVHFERFATPLGRHYDVAAFRLGEGRFATVFSDITERRRAEERVRLQGAALEAAANAVMITDREGRIVWVNDAFARLTGWSLDECRGQTPQLLKSGHHDRPFYEELWRTILGGGVWRREMVNRRRSGELYVEEQTITPVTDEQGAITHFVAIKIDIGERKQAEEALRASEARYRSLFDDNLAGVCRVALDGTILECNAAFARIFGYAAPEDARGRNAVELYADAASRAPFIERLRTEGRLLDCEIDGRRRDGSPVRILENASLVGEGGERHIVGTVMDITERQRLEEQLRQAQKMEAIGQLASGVAHDFNNLLAVIGGHSELVLQALPADHPQRRRIEAIRAAGERAAGLTRQLLAFGRKQALEPVVLDLAQVVAGMEDMLRRLLPENIELGTVFDPGAGRVKADRGQIERVILNLAVNARDAMPQGGRLVTETAAAELDEGYCRARPGVRPGRYVLLAMSDTGLGMDAETQAHVFEPFFTTKEPGKGTGLGLATVYGIVRQHEGHVAVYSEPGRGTTLRVYLPQVDQEAGREEAAPAPAPAGLAGGTVLLVEDDEGVRLLTREILESLGYDVLEARDGDEALALSGRHPGPLRLLLTDMVMPGMTGRQLAERLRASRPGLRVLFVSGYSSDMVVRNGERAAATAFLQKPFTPDQLDRKIREAMSAPEPAGE